MARATGGDYLRVTSAATDPTPILRQIDRLEKRTLESETVTTREERFQWALALAATALLVQLAAGPFASGRGAAGAAGRAAGKAAKRGPGQGEKAARAEQPGTARSKRPNRREKAA
jgi:hypothetical protein